MDISALDLILKGQRREHLHVGEIDLRLAKIIGANITSVHLSLETATKQIRKHPELTLEHYKMIEMAFEFGFVVCDRDRHLCFVYEDEIVFNYKFYAVVKATKPGDELFLQSFRRLEPRKYRSILKKYEIIREHYPTKR